MRIRAHAHTHTHTHTHTPIPVIRTELILGIHASALALGQWAPGFKI